MNTRTLPDDDGQMALAEAENILNRAAGVPTHRKAGRYDVRADIKAGRLSGAGYVGKHTAVQP